MPIGMTAPAWLGGRGVSVTVGVSVVVGEVVLVGVWLIVGDCVTVTVDVDTQLTGHVVGLGVIELVGVMLGVVVTVDVNVADGAVVAVGTGGAGVGEDPIWGTKMEADPSPYTNGQALSYAVGLGRAVTSPQVPNVPGLLPSEHR
jgi:hypothetical protein